MNKEKKLFNNLLELICLISVPAALCFCVALNLEASAIMILLVCAVAIFMFLLNIEHSTPRLRQIVPSATLGALAAAGRILFAPVPDFKPVSAICIISGVIFGKRSGFLVGCIAALLSNFFFGQGPWTPWQMYAWGIVGYLSGVLNDCGAFKKKPVIYVFAFFSGILYGFILNSYYIIGFVHPLKLESAILAYGAGFFLDLIHCVATVIFLVVLFEPWKRKLIRIRDKFNLV